MKTAIKITILCIVLTIMGILTTSEFKDIQADDEIIYSTVDPRYHDKSCNCDFCWEESAYYMEIAGIDSTIKLGQNLTVISIDTVENTTCISLK